MPTPPETANKRLDEFLTWVWRKLGPLTGATSDFAAGGLVFGDANGFLTQDAAQIFWDDANNRLGIGTATPTEVLDVIGVVKSSNVRKNGDMENIGFSFSGDTLTINQANGSAFADTPGNRGYVWMRSHTDGRIIRGKIVANVSLDIGGAHWGMDGLGDLTNIFLRVYCINDGNTNEDFTPKWGVCLQGGFYYIRNTQDDTTAANINLPEKILVNSNVTNDFSNMFDAGFFSANFTDAANTWAINNTQPGVSADDLWMDYGDPNFGGFAVAPTPLLVRWTMHGQKVTYQYTFANPGTSNAVDYTMTAPIKAQDQYHEGAGSFAYDNGVALTNPTLVNTRAASNVLDIYSDFSGAGWTNVNDKVSTVKITYEAYQP